MPETPITTESVRVLIQNEEGQVLTVRRPDDSASDAGLYELPGGKVDPGESLEEAIRRECKEETGLNIEIVGGELLVDDYPITDGKRMGERLVAHGFIGRVIGGEIGTGSEQMETMWLPAEEVMNSDKVKSTSRKAAALLLGPPDAVDDIA